MYVRMYPPTHLLRMHANQSVKHRHVVVPSAWWRTKHSHLSRRGYAPAAATLLLIGKPLCTVRGLCCHPKTGVTTRLSLPARVYNKYQGLDHGMQALVSHPHEPETTRKQTGRMMTRKQTGRMMTRKQIGRMMTRKQIGRMMASAPRQNSKNTKQITYTNYKLKYWHVPYVPVPSPSMCRTYRYLAPVCAVRTGI